MRVSYQWLRELTGVDWPVEEMADRLTLCGTACEDIIATDRYLDKVVVGEVTGLGPIKGADKIKLATVNLGSETMDLVCGAPNVAVGQKVAVAQVGARLSGDIVIKKAKIRGVESRGMICSERELGFSDDHSGILVLEVTAVPGTPLVEHLDYHDYIMVFELTPNRGDSMSAIGIARDLAGLAGTTVKYPEAKLNPISDNVADHFDVISEDPIGCPRFTARMIRNVKIGPSPWWIQKKLLACGMRPISNVVDIANLVMLETGNPVHTFDYDMLASDKIVVRRAKEGEKLTTLDGKDHKLTPDVLLITDCKRARASAGVMGGIDSEVTDDTRNILLEVAYFDPSVVRKSRKALGMTSEASQRFEKGVDPNNLDYASARVCSLFAELCDGEVLDGMIDWCPKPIERPVVTMRPDRCNSILGTELSPDKMVETLRGLEFEVVPGDPIEATIPTFRHDIEREIDLIEEVARMVGYDAIPDAIENSGPLFAPENPMELFQDEIRTVLTGAGFDEILGHGLADSKQAELLTPGAPQLRIINPVSEDLDIMRLDLGQTALNAVSHNLAHRNLDMKLFEIGRVYPPPNDKDEWVEEERLVMAVSGSTEVTWREKPRPLDYYDLKGGLDLLVKHFHWPDLKIVGAEHAYLEAGEAFALELDGKVIGSVGQVNPKIARKFEIKQPVYLLQLILTDLFVLGRSKVEFEDLPVFPAANRDLAIVVDRGVKVGDIVGNIASIAPEITESVTPFDLYEGQQIGEGKKSVAVSIRFRSRERSLSSEEVDATQQNIVDRLKKEFKAEIRDG